jgi:hypothetical protein
MVEESKDGGPQGFERGQSLKLVVCRLSNHSDVNCVTAFRSVQSLNNTKLK